MYLQKYKENEIYAKNLFFTQINPYKNWTTHLYTKYSSIPFNITSNGSKTVEISQSIFIYFVDLIFRGKYREIETEKNYIDYWKNMNEF